MGTHLGQDLVEALEDLFLVQLVLVEWQAAFVSNL